MKKTKKHISLVSAYSVEKWPEGKTIFFASFLTSLSVITHNVMIQ
jgi:hypothetical protein